MSFKDGIHEDSLEAAMVSWHRYTVERLPWSGELRLKKPWVDPVTGEVSRPEIYPNDTRRPKRVCCQPVYFPENSFMPQVTPVDEPFLLLGKASPTYPESIPDSS